jgi:hypothetical protein
MKPPSKCGNQPIKFVDIKADLVEISKDFPVIQHALKMIDIGASDPKDALASALLDVAKMLKTTRSVFCTHDPNLIRASNARSISIANAISKVNAVRKS